MGRTRRITGEGGRSTAPENHGRGEDLSFRDAVEPFIRACPGPAPAAKALRLVAYQAIKGIPGLEPEDSAHSKPSKNHDGGKSSPIRTLKDAASAVFYTADHLTKQARRYGYCILLAIRWVTFLQGYALHEQGASQTLIARRLGFSDASSWSRFVKNLTGKTPTQLPRLQLSDWAIEARRRVFFGPDR